LVFCESTGRLKSRRKIQEISNLSPFKKETFP
jgi:hypothetical protein